MTLFPRCTSLILLLIASVAPPAFGEVTFEPSVGGAVSREKIQGGLGWGERKFRAHGEKVTFNYEMIDWYTVTCRSKTEEGEIVETASTISRSVTLDVQSAPTYESDRDGRRQISGYELMGFKGEERVEGSIPSVGDPCQGHGGAEGRVIRSELEHVRDTLYVNQGEMKFGIWFESY
jgi:hypothetical protein